MVIVAVESLDATSELHVHFDIFRALHAVLGSPVDRAVGALRESAQAAKARSIDEAFAASQASAAAPKKKKRKNGAAPVKKEKKRKKSKKKDR